MNNKMKKSIDRLNKMDAYMDKNIRNTYINHIVFNLKRGIFPKGSIERVEKLIGRHNKIVMAKKSLKSRG